MDVSKPEENYRFRDEIMRVFGRADTVLLNAGIFVQAAKMLGSWTREGAILLVSIVTLADTSRDATNQSRSKSVFTTTSTTYLQNIHHHRHLPFCLAIPGTTEAARREALQQAHAAWKKQHVMLPL
jgi:hypothetical protein